MKNDKDKWYFTNIPSRPKLTADEVVYWRTALKKILKVGIEFEFNLPEKRNGTCKGDSYTCPCVNLVQENDCWKECLNSAECATYRDKQCFGIYCSSFVGTCLTCENYKTNCEECAYKFDPNKNPDAIREKLHEELKPNNTYGLVSDTGVHSITTDGSLLGGSGAEIITVGRRVDYWEFFKMASNILKRASSRGAYMNERCSIHMHALASYYGKVINGQEQFSIPSRVSELEKDMPEIILANLHQLVRRYQNAITWMVMGLDTPERMTRWEKFRVSVLPTSAIMNHMMDVRSSIAQTAAKSKYGWINYEPIEFSGNGEIKRFHVEFRAADGLMSPSAVAAIACMYYALVIKAVEISRFGVVEIGDQSWLKQAMAIKSAILNNTKDWKDGDRFGDTQDLHKYYDVLVHESLDLVRQLKAILIKTGPAFDVLEKLAERPIALRRCDGRTWEQIENELKVIVDEEGQLEIAIAEIVTLNQVAECKDIDEWVRTVFDILSEDPELNSEDSNIVDEGGIREYVRKNFDDGKLVWSNSIGAPIMI